jgi:hypothetical protein
MNPMARHPFIMLTASILLAAMAGIGWAGPDGGGDSYSMPIVRPLIGSTLPQIVQMLGHPFLVTPLRESGGKLLFFENSDGDKFVIETDGTDHVVDAYVKHRGNR